jgi:hypothetical protein
LPSADGVFGFEDAADVLEHKPIKYYLILEENNLRTFRSRDMGQVRERSKTLFVGTAVSQHNIGGNI